MTYVNTVERYGRREGRTEGIQIGQVTVLKRLLMRRFGTLNPDINARIEAATPTQLDWKPGRSTSWMRKHWMTCFTAKPDDLIRSAALMAQDMVVREAKATAETAVADRDVEQLVLIKKYV